ncbi:MAG TPA: alternate F1F0 ATPase, F1 subunit alpha [Geminicoccaceae bacterium]|nr:alternate F1F0 ATPase, F1 subunit alpha [Geminicoccaceae bacterium]
MTDRADTSELGAVTDATFDPLDRAVQGYRARPQLSEVGTVVQVASGIARVTGLQEVRDSELIALPNQLLGIATNLAMDGIGIILLGQGGTLRTGDPATRTHRVVDMPVGPALLGRVVDATGRPLDRDEPIAAEARWPIERPAPPIMARAPVAEPLQTGIKAVDAAIPIGRGQRELILGDRQTGKTTIALDAIINQRRTGMVSIYCAIGQRGAAVARAVAVLKEHDALERCVVVVAAGDDPAGLQFVAPYAATTIAEYFMEQGQDVLIVYDDLTRHARAYRELSLLLRRPPGREAYPGDIFYIHSRLLERSTHLREELGGGSLTALPIIETQAQNLSAYIPTNLISITDGQIYLSPELFRKGQLPAVDIGKSVSRVGGKAQLPALRAVAGDLRLGYAQFEELETFARFGTRLDEATRQSLARGQRVRAILRQAEHDPLTVPEQLVVVLAATTGVLDDVPVERVAEAEAALRRAVTADMPELGPRLASGEKLGDEERERLLALARSASTPFRA